MLNFALSSNAKDVASHFSSTVPFSAHVFDTFVMVNVHTEAGSHSIAHSSKVHWWIENSAVPTLHPWSHHILPCLSSVVFPILF